MSKVLIVDDDYAIANLIADVLKEEGIESILRHDGASALFALEQEEFDLILLDIMLPKITGYDLMRHIRNQVSCPILFVTAKNQMEDKIEGFTLGADDYITKPFAIDELLARVKAHLRREKRSISLNQEKITIGDITLNKEFHTVEKNSQNISLSTKEFSLLSYLMEHAGTTTSKEQIYNSVWQSEYGDIGTVAVNINSLRKKIDPEGKYIITIWGEGYKFIKEQKDDK